jgi:hypothetical protein
MIELIKREAEQISLKFYKKVYIDVNMAEHKKEATTITARSLN